MKIAVTLIVIFLILGLLIFLIVPFFLQNISFPGFSSGGKGIAGIFKSNDGGDFWFSRNAIDYSKSTIGNIGITDIVFDPFDNNIMYIGTEGSGIFKSINNGESWRRIADENNFLSQNSVINQIAINPKNPTHIYVSVFQNGSGVIFKTENAGQSWKQLYIVPISGYDIKTLATDPSNPDLLYAGTTDGGFLTSSDGGESWRALKWFFDPIKRIIIKPSSPSEIFLLVGKTFYKTNDGGNNWNDITGALSNYPSATKIENLILDPQRPNVLYMTSAYGLLRSDDNGNSWKPIKILVPPEALPVQDLAIDKNDYRTLYMSADSKMYISHDGGENWTVKSLNTGKIAKIIRIDPRNSRVIFVGIHK